MFLMQIMLFLPKFQNLALTEQGTYAIDSKCTVKYIICAKLIKEDTLVLQWIVVCIIHLSIKDAKEMYMTPSACPWAIVMVA